MWRKVLLAASEPDEGRLLALCALLALAAGGAKSWLTRTPNTTWKDWLASSVAAGVAGLIAAMISLHYKADCHIVGPIAGIAGWLGASLLDYLAGQAMRHVRTKLEDGGKDGQP